MGSGAFEQAPADIGGTEAVLEIHCVAQAVDLDSDEVAHERALKEAKVVAASGIAGGGSAAVAGGGKLKRLRFGRAHTPRNETQALRALLDIDDRADEVALVAPKLQHAAAVRLSDRVTRSA